LAGALSDPEGVKDVTTSDAVRAESAISEMAGEGSALPVVLEVWAPWCGPCRAMAPGLEAAAAEFAGQVQLERINADDDPARVEALGVRSIPTTILLREGAEVGRHVGVLNPTEIRELFARMAQGETPVVAALLTHAGMSPTTRLLRTLAAAALATVGLSIGLSSAAGWFFLGVGGVVFFTAIHDRCPLWQAVRRTLGLGGAAPA
jgi:thioredoxin